MRWNLALGALAASWGFIAVLVASVDLGAGPLAFWRLALAAATLGVAALVAGRIDLLSPAGRLPALTLLGVAQGAHWLLFFEAVDRGSVALAVLTFYAAPLLIALVAPLVLPEPLSATSARSGSSRSRSTRAGRVERRRPRPSQPGSAPPPRMPYS
jgi:drug/metabolite transporter (DMT)-like permease